MNIHYSIPKDKREEILCAAIEIAYFVKVDQLDCSKSWMREDTDKTVEEVLNIGLNDKNTLYSFILRGAFQDNTYYEAGLSTIGFKIDYFLWINLSLENGQKIIDKYGLTDKK